MALLLIGASLPPSTTAQEVEWINQFGTSADDAANAVSVHASGVYLAGWTDGTLPGEAGAGGADAFVRKFDIEGHDVWTRQFGTSGEDVARGIYSDASGVYVAGWTDGTLPGQAGAGGADAFVRKYDLDGNEVWTRQFGSPDLDMAIGIFVDASGVYLAGGTNGTLPGQTKAGLLRDAFVRKYDLDGNEVWTRQFGSFNDGFDEARGISVYDSGVYVSGGTTRTLPGQTNSGLTDAFVSKYDLDGNEVWTRQFGSPASESARAVSASASGVYVVGETLGTLPGQTSAGNFDAFVRKYDFAGNEVWTRQFGSDQPFPADFDMAFGVSADDFGVYVAGLTRGALPDQTREGMFDAFVRRYASFGGEIWTFQFGTSLDDTAIGISAGASGVYAVGLTEGVLADQPSSGASDAYVVKLAAPMPAELIQHLIADVVAIDLKKGISNSLYVMLNAAFSAIDDMNDGNNTAAIGALIAFINSVEAQRGGRIAEADADALIVSAWQIIDLLESP